MFVLAGLFMIQVPILLYAWHLSSRLASDLDWPHDET